MASSSALAFKPYKVDNIEAKPRPAPEVTAAKYPGADAAVVEEEAEVKLFDPAKPDEGFLWTETARVKVLSPAGRAMARVHVGSTRDLELLSIAGRSFSDAEHVRDLSGKPIAFFGDAEPLSPMYSDRVAGFFDVPGVEVGDIIEYKFQFRRKGVQALPGWRFSRVDVPVVESRIVFALPEGWQVEHVLQIDGKARPITPEKKKADGIVRWTFTQKDMKPVEQERLGPSDNDLGYLLVYAVSPPGGPANKTWEEVAGHYRKFVSELAPLGPDGLTRANPPQKTPQAIFEWVRDNVRYVAIHEGLGGLQPHAPGQVLTQRWGDCKDMATLLVSLYELAGIEAHQVLVASLARGRVRSAIPRISAFDHVIVALPKEGGGYQFVDPTAKNLVFGELSPQIQGQPALVVKPNGSEPIELPWTGGRRWQLSWTIAQDRLSSELEIQGEPAAPWRGWSQRSVRAQKRAARNLLADRSAAKVQTSSITESGNRVHVSATYRAKRLALDSPEGRFIILGKLFGSAHEYRVARDRKAPVELGPPAETVERVVYKKSPGEKLVRAPKSVSWKGEGLAFELEVRETPDEITIERKYSFKQPRLPPERFSELSRLADLIYQSSVEALLVRGAAPLSMRED